MNSKSKNIGNTEMEMQTPRLLHYRQYIKKTTEKTIRNFHRLKCFPDLVLFLFFVKNFLTMGVTLGRDVGQDSCKTGRGTTLTNFFP